MLSENIEAFKFPSNSPDLNPIENLWGIVKLNLRQRVFNNKADWIKTNFKLVNVPVEFSRKIDSFYAKGN